MCEPNPGDLLGTRLLVVARGSSATDNRSHGGEHVAYPGFREEFCSSLRGCGHSIGLMRRWRRECGPSDQCLILISVFVYEFKYFSFIFQLCCNRHGKGWLHTDF